MVDETDATPPQDSDEKKNVVQAEFGKPRASRKKADASAKPAGGDDAPSKGKGAVATGSAKPAKPKKTIDWGKVNTLTEDFALIYGLDLVWDGRLRRMIKISNLAHAVGADVVKMWKGSDKRRTILPEDIVFSPQGELSGNQVNLYNGIEMEPEAGDVQPVVDLIKFLCSRVSDDEIERDAIVHWLTCWLAYPLQHVGTKLRTAVIMHGDEGAGKNFLFDLMVEIFGKYGALVGQDELEDKFNDWRSGKLMVIGDEVSSRAELVHNKNRLKSLITSATVQINPKNQARREEKNAMNIVFLSNELQPLALDNSDRRYLVIYTPRANDQAYYDKLRAWRAQHGPARFYHYLLHYDCGDFNPYAPAPFTEAKKDLIDINRKSPERFWAEWEAGFLDLPYSACSVEQAYQAYTKFAQRIGDRFPLQANVFSRMVTRFSEGQGRPVRIKTMQITQIGGGRKAYRMLLVAEPILEGFSGEGEWATKAVQSFGVELRKYTGGAWNPRSPTEAEQAERGGE